jgi:hypothetical protein
MVTRSPLEIRHAECRAGKLVGEVLDLIGGDWQPFRPFDYAPSPERAHHQRRPVLQGFGISRDGIPPSIASRCPRDHPRPGAPGERSIWDGMPATGSSTVDGEPRGHSTSGKPAVAGLIDLTREAMMAGIAAAVPGNHIDDISAAVEAVAKRGGLGVIRQFVGHGIGTEMHEEPQVPNYRTGRPGRKLEPGLCLAIEPMFTLGGWDTRIEPDDWTVVTADGSLAAHFEHSIAITDDGPSILTVA